jgi:hypothetical protein
MAFLRLGYLVSTRFDQTQICRPAELFALEVGASVPADEANNPRQQHRSDYGDYDADDKSVLSDSAESQEIREEPADECADQADHHVHDEAKS